MRPDLPRALGSAVLVSGNPGKALEARRIVGAQLETAPLDLPEIQSLDLLEILRFKAEEAWRRLERPLIVDETALELGALNGFPGPLIKWMLQAVGPEGIATTALALGETSAVARCALLYFDGTSEVVGEGTAPGAIVAPRGEGGFGWDPIFLPEGESKTYAELPSERKDLISHRSHALKDLQRKLQA